MLQGIWNFCKATLGIVSGVVAFCLLLAGVIWIIGHWREIAEEIGRLI